MVKQVFVVVREHGVAHSFELVVRDGHIFENDRGADHSLENVEVVVINVAQHGVLFVVCDALVLGAPYEVVLHHDSDWQDPAEALFRAKLFDHQVPFGDVEVEFVKLDQDVVHVGVN